MNWIDLTIVLLLVFFVLEGIKRSFIGELLDLLSFLIAFFISLRFYNFPGSFFESSFQIPHSVANVLSFIITWFLAEAIFMIAAHILILKIPIFLRINTRLNSISFIPAFFRGIVFISLLLLVVGTFPFQPKIKKDIFDSKIGSVILSRTQNLEQPLKSVFGGITQDTLSFLTIKPKSKETVSLGFMINDFKENKGLEEQMIGLVNKEREKRGIKTLQFDDRLKNIALEHSADMFKRGYFSHYSPEGKTVADRASSAGIFYLVIGENLAFAPSLSTAHTGLMNSEGHRANILSTDYSKMGIGIMDGGPYGIMVTQVFSN